MGEKTPRKNGNSYRKPPDRAPRRGSSLKVNNRPTQKPNFRDISFSVNLPSPEQLQTDHSAAEALLTVRAELKALDVGHKQRVRSRVAVVYGIALFLRADETGWVQFTRHKEWEDIRNRPQLDDRSNALQFALRFAVGLGGKAKSKRASKYYRALAALFEKSVPAQDIPRHIEKAGGFDALGRKHARKKDSPGSPPDSGPDGPEPIEYNDQDERSGSIEKHRKPAEPQPPIKTDEPLVVTIVVPSSKNIARLLRSTGERGLTMRFGVDRVQGRTVTISGARVMWKSIEQIVFPE